MCYISSHHLYNAFNTTVHVCMNICSVSFVSDLSLELDLHVIKTLGTCRGNRTEIEPPLRPRTFILRLSMFMATENVLMTKNIILILLNLNVITRKINWPIMSYRWYRFAHCHLHLSVQNCQQYKIIIVVSACTRCSAVRQTVIYCVHILDFDGVIISVVRMLMQFYGRARFWRTFSIKKCLAERIIIWKDLVGSTNMPYYSYS